MRIVVIENLFVLSLVGDMSSGMGREVVEVLMDRNADVSSGRVHVAPKIAAEETDEEFEVKECTEEKSLSENAPNVGSAERIGAQKSPKTRNGNAKVSKVKLIS